MNITMNSNDRVRISTYQGTNFVDVNCLEWEMGIRIDGHPNFHYIEIREKEGQLSTFYFHNKRAKKDLDLGWWQDAEVVFARNKCHNKNNKE